MIVDNVPMSIQFWDTAGMERFRSMQAAYFKGADICILVYDMTSRESFIELDYWLEQVSENFGLPHVNGFPVMLVATKVDQSERREVSTSNPIQYVQCSVLGNA